MSVKIWGPPIWCFFHTLAEQIKEDRFNEIFMQLFAYIRRICRVLPCPDCSEHATQFLLKVNPAGIRCKQDFKNVMFFFHNSVNKRKGKPIFDINNLSQYANIPVIIAYNNFVAVFRTKGNMKLLADSFQRQMLLKEFRIMFLNNISCFIK